MTDIIVTVNEPLDVELTFDIHGGSDEAVRSRLARAIKSRVGSLGGCPITAVVVSQGGTGYIIATAGRQGNFTWRLAGKASTDAKSSTLEVTA